MNKNLLILGVLLLLVLGALLFVFKDRIPISNNDYDLPNSLTYSQKSGWSDVSGEGWMLSLKDDWQLGSISELENSATYSNKRQGEDSIFISVRPPILMYERTVDEELELWSEVDKSSQSPQKFIKSQKLTTNEYETGIIFSKVKDRNLINLNIFIDKGGTIYTIGIFISENFYKSNKADIEYLIASFR